MLKRSLNNINIITLVVNDSRLLSRPPLTEMPRCICNDSNGTSTHQTRSIYKNLSSPKPEHAAGRRTAAPTGRGPVDQRFGGPAGRRAGGPAHRRDVRRAATAGRRASGSSRRRSRRSTSCSSPGRLSEELEGVGGPKSEEVRSCIVVLE
jgi:hypothetical protein